MKYCLRGLIALLLLNTALSFVAIWPTVWVKPDWLIAPECVLLVVLLAAWLAWAGRVPRRVVGVMAAVYLLLVFAHYADVVVPNLLGRPVNLYWDVPQLPRFLWVTATGQPVWLTVLSLVLVGTVLCSLHWVLQYAMQVLAHSMAPVARRMWLWVVLLPMGSLVVANYAGVEATWAVLCKPVIPTYWREAVKLWDAFSPAGAAKLLPPTTVIDQALSQPAGQVLGALHHRDMMLMFLETYGAMLYDQPDAVNAVADSRRAWEQSILDSGRHVVSAFYTSPTIGGGSELAQMSLLSGIDLNLNNPRRFDVLMTTHRPTLLKVFQREGYEVIGLYHSVFWNWVERVFYGFDTYLDGPSLGYTGPALGYWKIPDQFAIARYLQKYPPGATSRPRLTVFPTISTHFPFFQVPPYQPDWKRVLGPEPFDAAAVAKAQAEQVNWANMRPDYYRTINYAHTWLAGYFTQPEPRETVYLMVGDHQPTGSVSGEGATWDVPVFVVSRDQDLLDRFRAVGFTDGLTPAHRQPLGGFSDLTGTLLHVLKH